MNQRIEKVILVNSSPVLVWNSLTDFDQMKKWMGDSDMQLEIITDWKAGNPIVIKGFHHAKFENKGVILQYETERILRYTHLSSLSHLADQPENYSIIEFRLTPHGNQTSLLLTLENFPTESIRRHLEFYWSTTLEIIKNLIENDEQQN